MPKKLTKKPTTKKPSASRPLSKATAVHGAHLDGTHHVVGIGNLRVVIVPDDNLWFAQGLEIDYAAQGTTVDEAKEHFENGLTATIQQHLRIYKSIKKLLRAAPPEVWQDVLLNTSAIYNRYSQVSVHEVMVESFPFEGIEYLVAASGA